LELESPGAGSESFLNIVFHHDCFELRGNTAGEYFLVGVLDYTFLDYSCFGSAFGTEVLM
jgi:hypothetical protein